MDEPTNRTATFMEWHRALCEYARKLGASAATEQGWMHTLFNREYTPAEAWDAFINNEVM